MKTNALFLSAAAMLITAANCHAAGKVEFAREATVDSTPATVWKYVGDFNGVDLWHPSVRNCTTKGSGNAKGAVRTLTLSDGSVMVEKLLSYNAAKTTYTYAGVKGPFPIKNYQSTISLSPTADGKTLMKWSSSFDPAGVDEDIATEWVSVALDGGLGKVVANFEKK
jgi:mxaD protein